MKKVTLALILFALFTGSVFAQERKTLINQDIQQLKENLEHATETTERLRLTVALATSYRLAGMNDSTKQYASLAIGLTKNISPASTKLFSTNELKMLKAKAIENFGSALAFESAKESIDTLEVSLQLWKETNNKPGIAMAYFSLANSYSFKGDNIEALDYFDKSLKLFEETKNKVYIAHALYNISLEKRYLGNYGDALEYSIKSLKVAHEIKDTLLITDALLGNSFNYMLAKKYPEALQEQEEALRLFELSKDSSGIARTYNDMGVTDMFAGKLDDALKFHKIALEMRKKLNDATDKSISHNYVATVYKRQGKFNEALATIMEGLPYSLEAGDSRFIMDNYLEAGDIYIELKDYANAIASYNSALEVAKKNNAANYQATALMQKSEAYKSLGNIKEALATLQLADKIVLPNDFKTRQSIYERMMQTYVKKNDYRSAYENQLKFQQMSDSVNTTEKAEKTTALTQQLIYENKRALQKASQDKEIAIKESQLTRQKLIRNLSIAGLLIGVVFALVFFIRFKEKRRLNITLEQILFDLKATQSQLIQSEKMASLGELTAGIAHEIQNPLNFVNNFSELSNELLDEMNQELENGELEEAKSISKHIRVSLEKINHHGKRAEGIVKGMLLHSRKSNDEKEPTNINELADEYLRLAYHGLRAKDKSFNATLETNFDESIGLINIIPQDMGRVILNLITNAFYVVNEKKLQNPEGYDPTVFISTKKIKDHVELKVRDNGNGIPKHVLDKIFQPFFTTKPTGQGTGLGLSMSYDIVKSHGGQLKVETEEGTGTTFIIQLLI